MLARHFERNFTTWRQANHIAVLSQNRMSIIARADLGHDLLWDIAFFQAVLILIDLTVFSGGVR